MWVRRTGRDWVFATRLGGDSQPEFPQDVDRRRYVAANSNGRLRLAPVMPDRPVVGSADTPFSLGPGVEARFYARIPVWVRATVGDDDRAILFESATRTLSNTWFGGVMTGRLCYSLDTKLVFLRSDLGPGEDIAVCSVRFRNQSRTPFSAGKIAIFADLVGVYKREPSVSGEPQLWTNQAWVTVLGPEQLNLSVSDDLPLPKAELRRLSEARVHAGENILRKGLILLRTISNY